MLKCRLAVLEVWRMIVETGYTNAVVCDFRVQNMVANFKFGQKIDLNQLYRTYQTESNYAPELFPGLIMRFTGTKVVYLVFESGKAVITGSQSVAEVHQKSVHLQGLLAGIYGVGNEESI
jgi:TATA-box binding protein (TBP) (component of TFIID and TFIIIB)